MHRAAPAMLLAACTSSTTPSASVAPPAHLDCEAVCSDQAPTSIGLRTSDCAVPHSLAGRGAVEGHLLDQSSSPASGYTVVLTGGPADDTPSTSTASDGSFHFQDLAPGRYQLTYSAPKGSERLAVEVCVIVDGGRTTSVTTHLGIDPCAVSTEKGTVQGRVVVPPPAGDGGQIYVNAWSRAGCLLAAAVTNSDGHFVLDDIPAGDHALVATYLGIAKEIPVHVQGGASSTADLAITQSDIDALRTRAEAWQRCRCSSDEDEP